MRPAWRYPVPFVLLLSLLLCMVMATRAADTAVPAPDGDAWLLLIVIGAIAIVVAAGILVFALRLVWAFRESTSSLIDALRALTPIPVVTIADEIPDGVEGRPRFCAPGSRP